ncbi:MAG: translocation/assembly module TamB, partial [Spirochaetales bacterium]|nr:translocation/assembly module TamB [Spirochaetales bacterium]
TIRAGMSAEATMDDDPFTLAARLSADVASDREGRELSASVDVGDIAGSHLHLDDQSFRIERRAENVSIQRIRSDDPLDLFALFDPGTGHIRLDIQSESYVPAESAEFYGPWERWAPLLATSITTDSTLYFDADTRIREAEGTIAAHFFSPALPEPLRISTDYRFDDATFTVPNLVVRASRGEARFDGRYGIGDTAPTGTLSLDRFAYGELPMFSGRATVSGSSNEARILAEALRVGRVDLFAVAGRLTRGSRYRSARLAFAVESDGSGRVETDARFASFEDVAAEVSLRDVSLHRIEALLYELGYEAAIPSVLSRTVVAGSARLDIRDESLHVRLPELSLRDPDDDNRVARVVGEYRDGTVVVERFTFYDDNLRIYADGFLRVASGGTIDFGTDLSINSVSYSLRGLYTAEDGLIVFGPHDIDVRLRRTAGGAFSLAGQIRETPLPAGGATMAARLEGLFFDSGNWYVTVEELHLRGLPVPGGGRADAIAVLSIGPGVVEGAVVELDDGFSTLAGTFEVAYSAEDDVEIQVNGGLASLHSAEQYRIAGRYAGGATALDIRFNDSPVRRFWPRARAGTVRGALQIVGTVAEPQVRVLVESDIVRVDEQEFQGRLVAFGDSEALSIDEARLQIGTTSTEISTLRVARDTGAIVGEGRILQAAGRAAYDVSLRAEVGSLEAFDVEEFTARPMTAELVMRPSTPLAADAAISSAAAAGLYRFDRAGGVTRVERDDRAVSGMITDLGDFSLTVSEPLPVRFEAAGRIVPGQIEVTASDVVADLPALADAVALDGAQIERGVARGSLRIIGAPGDPDLFGTLAVRDFALGLFLTPDTIGPIDGTLIFEEKTVRLPATSTAVGAAPVTLDGRAAFSRFNVEGYELNVVIAGEDGMRIESALGPVEVVGFGRGALRIAGDRGVMRVSGDVIASGADIALATEEDAADRETSERNLELDLTLETGRGVQFLWPDSTFPILRSNFAVGQTVAIVADTADELFAMEGSVAIQSGDVFYFDRNFFIRDGRIDFQENQENFDPRLTARAEIRDVTPEGPVRIYLVADGQRLSEFSPRFESNPPLAGDEIVAILGGDIFQQGSAAVNLSTALLSTTNIATQFGVFRRFEDAVREQFDLDLFAVRTSVIQNLLITAINPADTTVQETAPSIGTYLNNTSIFMGRYLGDAVFGQFLVQMRSRDTFDPATQEIERIDGVLIDSEISLEWQTPFFLLE